MIIASITVVLTLTLASLAAFAFAHLRFFGDRFLMSYLLIGMMFPAATAILPIFIKVRNLGLLDTAWGVVLPQVAFGLGMAILLLRNAFKQLPSELLDAALVDGCGYIRYFLLVTLPLSLPILATVAIIAFVGSWNNYLLPLILLNTDNNFRGRSASWPIRASSRPPGNWCWLSSPSRSCRRSSCSCWLRKIYHLRPDCRRGEGMRARRRRRATQAGVGQLFSRLTSLAKDFTIS